MPTTAKGAEGLPPAGSGGRGWGRPGSIEPTTTLQGAMLRTARESRTSWAPSLVAILLVAGKETQLTLQQSEKIYQEDFGLVQE